MKIWKIIFWTYVVLIVLSHTQLLHGALGFVDILGLLIAAFTAMALYGLAYQVGYGYRAFPVIVFWLNLIMLISVILATIETSIVTAIVILVLFGTVQYGLYVYAYKSPTLWKREV